MGALLDTMEKELEAALTALADMLDSGFDVTAAHTKSDGYVCGMCSVLRGKRISCPALAACLAARRILNRE